jgi:hypothetical protein
MNLPDVPAEYYLCWSSILVGTLVPLAMLVLGFARKDRRLVSLSLVAGSIFVFYIAYWFWFLLALDDPDRSMVPAYGWIMLGGIIVFGAVILIGGVLMLLGKSIIGVKLADWLGTRKSP